MRLVVYDGGERVGSGWTLFDNDYGQQAPTMITDEATTPEGIGIALREGWYQLHILSHEIALLNETIQ
jgi:hypothetical protein